MFDSPLSSFTSLFVINETLSNFTLVKGQLVLRKDMDVNEHERLSNITLVKEKLVLRTDMDVNKHRTLSTITLRHKLK
jgi:uncharacterized membrane protein